MFNIIIFLLGAGIMFFMALRSVLARRRLCTQGQKVTATVEGTVQSRDGSAYVLEKKLYDKRQDIAKKDQRR